MDRTQPHMNTCTCLRRGAGGYIHIFICKYTLQICTYRKLLKAGNLVSSSTGRVPDNWQQNLSSRLRTGWGQTFGPRKSIKNLAWTSHAYVQMKILTLEKMYGGKLWTDWQKGLTSLRHKTCAAAMFLFDIDYLYFPFYQLKAFYMLAKFCKFIV